MGNKKFDWEDYDLLFSGQPIENVSSIEYTPEYFETVVFNVGTEEIEKDNFFFEYYLYRYGKAYFRSKFGGKFSISFPEKLSVKYGTMYKVSFD